jgi:subtilisin family serine protease
VTARVAFAVALAALAVPASAAAFVPDDPLFAKQWHLSASRAFDAWDVPPDLPRVRVAVIDSGVDGGHPDLRDRILAHKSFVGGSALEDTQGHGTFVAGLIAAETNNTTGIAGLGLSADLLVAKVVNDDGLIDVEAEADAIRWAVRNGASVINMSFGGLRDPYGVETDTFSPVEAAAIEYATRRDVVVVAAVGNADAAPREPWPYASYPAALPHVLGVSALARDGSSPTFSNRDRIYNDLAAPGEGLVSTFPRDLTDVSRECLEQGYSVCGPDDYRKGEGTSFAAAQVSAAAAVVRALRPRLRAEQVTALLTRTAIDANAGTGCRPCPLERDALTGWGRLDVTAAVRALDGQLPPRDAFEPNDDAGRRAVRLGGRVKRIRATLDFWDDQNDVYAIRLRRGQPVYVSVRGVPGTDTNLILWKPGTRHIDDLAAFDFVARQSARPGPREYLQYRARKTGWHYVQVKLGSRGAGRYRLTIVKA